MTKLTVSQGFYINLPVGAIVAIPILFLDIPEQIPKDSLWNVLRKLHHHLDLVGFMLFAPAITQLLLALQFGGNQFAWSSSQVIGLFCGAAANLVAWIVWDIYKKDDALLPVSLVKRRPVWAGALYHSLLMSTLFGVVYYLPIYFQAVQGMSAVMSGVNLLPTILPQIIVAMGCGFLGKLTTSHFLAYLSAINLANFVYSDKSWARPTFCHVSGNSNIRS